MEQFADKTTTELRRQVINTRHRELTITRKLSYAGACASIIAGSFGMIYCLPYLFSPILEDLVGAGFPFLGGAILFASGLISLSILVNQNKLST